VGGEGEIDELLTETIQLAGERARERTTGTEHS
jgi:hypothetical protein